GDLPGQAPPVLAPAARTCDAAVGDDRIPVPVGLDLILGEDLERKGLGVLERGAAVEAETSDAEHRELYREHLPLLPSRVIAGGAVHCGDGAVREGLGVEPGGFFCGAVEPEANHVLGHRLCLLVCQSASGSAFDNRTRTTEIDVSGEGGAPTPAR